MHPTDFKLVCVYMYVGLCLNESHHKWNLNHTCFKLLLIYLFKSYCLHLLPPSHHNQPWSIANLQTWPIANLQTRPIANLRPRPTINHWSRDILLSSPHYRGCQRTTTTSPSPLQSQSNLLHSDGTPSLALPVLRSVPLQICSSIT